MPRWNRHRRDGNHAELVKALEKVGFSVLDLSQVGGGCPDLLVAKHGWMTLVEVKDGRGKISEAQSDFAQAWHGDVYLIRGLEGIDMLLSEYEMAARDARASIGSAADRLQEDR